MSVLVDVESRRITAGVGDLLGEATQRAIGLSGSGLSRMWIGQELHRRVQDELMATEPAYRTEVAARLELDIDGWSVVVSGRADGVVVDDGRVVHVDEIKTLHFAVDLYHLFAQDRLDRFRNQLRLYAYMLSPPDRPASARLILVDIVSTEERDEQVEWSPESVHAWLRQQIHRLISAERQRLARLEELQKAAELIPFPHPQPRPSQPVIGEAVSEALAASRHLLIRAPTGCGKTAAVMHPALKAALSGGHRLFFLTAKTLQQRLAVETTRAMQGKLFRSMQLRAKAKMCAHTEMICHEEHCPYAREYGLKLVRHQLRQRLLADMEHLDPDQIFSVAQAFEVCPFELCLDLLPEVDCVVCDYNYVFDPAIGLSAVLGTGSLRNAVLVIDEAHNLVDRSREYFSPTLSMALVDRARGLLASRDTALFAHLRALVDHLGELISQMVSDVLGEDRVGDAEASFDEQALADLRMALDGAILEYFLFKRENKMWLADDPVLDVFLAVTRFHRILQLGGEEFFHIASRPADREEQLRIFCLDASRFVGEVLSESAGVIAMSATLEPFDFYSDLLGFDPQRTDTLHVPSPFPPENQLVLALPTVDTSYRQRALHFDAIAGWIARLAQPGHNALVLFPSYAFLSAVQQRLPAMSHRVLVQRQGSSDAEQHRFLAALDNGEPHLILAVLGGIYAEGVDYPGQMLSQVFVVSPGLPQFNAERELLKAYYREHYGQGFSYAYLIPGLTRVIQAAGRLIRSDTDRGSIVLMGRRFLHQQYFRLLPEEWTGGDPAELVVDDPEAAVRDFFEPSCE